MIARRFSLALALATLGFSGHTVSAVTFTATFEKTLASGLATLTRDLQAYPKLQAAVSGVPLDVAGWAALSTDQILSKLSALSTQKADAVQYLVMDDPAGSASLDKFMDDSSSLILAFAEAIESGDYATTTGGSTSAGASTTPAPVTVGGSPAAGSPSTPAGSSASTPASGSATAPAKDTPSAPSAGKPSTPATGTITNTASGSAPVSVPSSPQGAKGVASKGASVVAGGGVASKSVGVSTPASDGTTSDTPSNTTNHSTGVSTMSITTNDNSTDTSNGAGTTKGDTKSDDPTQSTNAQATAGSARMTLSTIAAAVVVATCAIVV